MAHHRERCPSCAALDSLETTVEAVRDAHGGYFPFRPGEVPFRHPILQYLVDGDAPMADSLAVRREQVHERFSTLEIIEADR